jgi:ubiquinone/menaquinone biosynthesis C-methylase UbiE
MANSMKEHWDRVYISREVCKLGWYEETPTPSLMMISKADIKKDESILDVGAGATTLIDNLIELGYRNIVAVDISAVALDNLKKRLGERKALLIKWIVDDITRPVHIIKLQDVTLWHDRAVLHFLLEEDQRQMYLNTLKKTVKRGGNVIIAAFSLKGAKKCSGLDVKNYDQEMLAGFLGKDFDLIEYFDYVYKMPSGDLRPYIYTLFKRTAV